MQLTQAEELALRTTDAFSADRYQDWEGVAADLLKNGLSLDEAEALMRSKYARWAADRNDGGRYGTAPAECLWAYFLSEVGAENAKGELKGLVEGTI